MFALNNTEIPKTQYLSDFFFWLYTNFWETIFLLFKCYLCIDSYTYSPTFCIYSFDLHGFYFIFLYRILFYLCFRYRYFYYIYCILLYYCIILIIITILIIIAFTTFFFNYFTNQSLYVCIYVCMKYYELIPISLAIT